MWEIMDRLGFTLSGRSRREKTTKTCQETSRPPSCPGSVSYVIFPDRMAKNIELSTGWLLSTRQRRRCRQTELLVQERVNQVRFMIVIQLRSLFEYAFSDLDKGF